MTRSHVLVRRFAPQEMIRTCDQEPDGVPWFYLRFALDDCVLVAVQLSMSCFRDVRPQKCAWHARACECELRRRVLAPSD